MKAKGKVMLKTASWFTQLPPDHVCIGISRGVPRGRPATTYRRYRQLEPGPWFKSVSIGEYLNRYGELLKLLDPKQVLADLRDLANGKTPVMVCFEPPEKVNTGEVWCHRHLAAQWIENRLGFVVEEIGHPHLDRFRKLRDAGIDEPRWSLQI